MADLSWIEIDAGRLGRNLARWRQALAGDAVQAHLPRKQAGASRFTHSRPRLCGVVKADAYGLGGPEVAANLAAAGVDMLAVYSPQQAEPIIAAGVRTPVLVMMPGALGAVSDGLAQAVRRGQVHFSLDALNELPDLIQLARRVDRPAQVHLHADTAMCRGGVRADIFAALLQRVISQRELVVTGLFSHFAAANSDADLTERQWAALVSLIRQHRQSLPTNIVTHLASTAGAARDARYHLGMVRVGLGMYGYGVSYSDGHTPIGKLNELQHVVRWLSRVTHVQAYSAGSRVGYGQGQPLERDSVLAVVPVGYGDGLPLSSTGHAQMRLPDVIDPCSQRPATVPVVGRVNMDQVVVDVTDAMQWRQVAVGATVEVIGHDPDAANALPRMAARANTTCYEMLCRLNHRVARRWIGGQPPVSRSAAVAGETGAAVLADLVHPSKTSRLTPV